MNRWKEGMCYMASSSVSLISGLECEDCGISYSHMEPINTCRVCNGLLEAKYDYDRLADRWEDDELYRRPQTLWRWRELMPVAGEQNIVTLGEGGTPLHRCQRLADQFGVKALYVKDETVNPTASLKDRTFTVAVSKAKELGVRMAVTRTSGNAGASFAAYCSKAGIRAVILCNAWASEQKLAMMQVYGHPVLRVKYDQAADIRKALDDIQRRLGVYEFTNFINPFRHEGAKAYAYEICQDLGWDVPDRLVQPVGTGGGIHGTWKGFNELQQLGLIDRLPKMTGVQPADCAPIVWAYDKHSPVAEPGGNLQGTIAQSIASNFPIGEGRRPLRAMYESGGCGITVTDDEILAAMRLLGREGVFAEPAAAAPVAAIPRLLEAGLASRDETIVCVATGSGLKQPYLVRRIFEEAPIIDVGDSPDFVERLLKTEAI